MKRMDEELSYYGFSLKDLVSAGVEVHYGEFGTGGAVSLDRTPAATASMAARTPFFGVGSVYACEKDPFNMCSPEEPNEVRDYRRRYYEKAAEYFRQEVCEYSGVKVAYIWGIGSFDVLNIYTGDDTEKGDWTDLAIISIIEEHNQRA
jgi:hypothetical protein